jgi:hypothetical protein
MVTEVWVPPNDYGPPRSYQVTLRLAMAVDGSPWFLERPRRIGSAYLTRRDSERTFSVVPTVRGVSLRRDPEGNKS